MIDSQPVPQVNNRFVKLSLCGDVMTGRGIDQILPHPSKPFLRESYMRSATGYVELAESASGPIPRAVPYSYIWGDALDAWAHATPDARIVNLETSVTTSDEYVPKGINYRMHPANIACLAAAGIDCCVLANNHVLDWGYGGLAETLATLRRAGFQTAGAGRSAALAEAPAVLELPGRGRLLVFARGAADSGIPESWQAHDDNPGIALTPDFSYREVDRLAAKVHASARPEDVVVLSIHWGGNWGYGIPAAHRQFAHAVLDHAGVDVVHGHSSHHPMGIEVHNAKPVLYGCGDFLNDYEGIGGFEEYRSELVLLYLLSVDPHTHTLLRLEMRPFQIRRFRLRDAVREDAEWLRDTLNREMRMLGTWLTLRPDNGLVLEWR